MTGGTLCFQVVRPSICPSHFRRTILCAAPSKRHAFSTNYHACIAMPTWPRCALPILFWRWPPYNLLQRSCLTWIFFVDFHWWVQLCVQRPPKAMPFQQIIMHASQCQHNLDMHLLFCFDVDLHITSSRGRVWLGFVRRSSLMGTTFRAAPCKRYAFSTHYNTCITQPTWCRCVPPILCWPWPAFNLFPRPCLTWILCAITIICLIYMYTYFVLTSIHLICSCFIHVQQHTPTRIVGGGHPCYNRSLFIVMMYMVFPSSYSYDSLYSLEIIHYPHSETYNFAWRLHTKVCN